MLEQELCGAVEIATDVDQKCLTDAPGIGDLESPGFTGAASRSRTSVPVEEEPRETFRSCASQRRGTHSHPLPAGKVLKRSRFGNAVRVLACVRVSKVVRTIESIWPQHGCRGI